jgi:hypothetical protein
MYALPQRGTHSEIVFLANEWRNDSERRNDWVLERLQGASIEAEG